MQARDLTPAPKARKAAQYDFVHTGPGTIAGRYLRQFWHPICMLDDLAPGTASPVRVLGEDFTVFRGETGVPHVVDFRCAHRRAQLWTGWVEGDCIRCFYHGWKYDASGQCVEQPAEDPKLAKSVKVAGYPTQEYLGLVFAYLGSGEAPPMPRYSEYDKPGLEYVRVSFIGEYNYFQNLENLVDPIHAAFAHRSFFAGTGAELAPVKAERSDWGITISRAGVGQGISQFGMPNVFQIGGALATPGAQSVVWVVPIDDESHKFYSVRAVPSSEAAGPRTPQGKRPDPKLHELAREVLAGKARIRDYESALDPLHYQLLEDLVVQGSQAKVTDRSLERLGRSDQGITMLRRLWQRELEALERGEALTQWKWTPELTNWNDWQWKNAT